MEKCVPKYGLHCWADGMEASLISVSQLGKAESLWQWAGRDHRYGKTWLEGAINILSEVIFSEVVSQVIPEAVFFSSATTLQSPMLDKNLVKHRLAKSCMVQKSMSSVQMPARNCRRLCDPKRLLVFSVATRIRTADQWSQGFITNYLFMFEFDSVKILQVKGATCGGLTWQHGYAWKLCEIPADKVKVPDFFQALPGFSYWEWPSGCVFFSMDFSWECHEDTMRHDTIWHLNNIE